MKIPELFVAKVRDFLLNPRNDRLKQVLLNMVEELEADDIDREALREMIYKIESGDITLEGLQ